MTSFSVTSTVRLQQRIFSRYAVDDDVEAVVSAQDPPE
jgi:hypothetical protein